MIDILFHLVIFIQYMELHQLAIFDYVVFASIPMLNLGYALMVNLPFGCMHPKSKFTIN